MRMYGKFSGDFPLMVHEVWVGNIMIILGAGMVLVDWVGDGEGEDLGDLYMLGAHQMTCVLIIKDGAFEGPKQRMMGST